MTHEDLVNYGYKPEDCKIGTLYFKGNLFCRLDNDVATVRTIQDDMTDIGKASTIEELKKIEKRHSEEYMQNCKQFANMILKMFDHYEKSKKNGNINNECTGL